MENDEVRNKISMESPITFMIGPIVQTAPAAMVYQLALQLKEGLLDKYEPIPGIPTSNDPNPRPYLRLIGDENVVSE